MKFIPFVLCVFVHLTGVLSSASTEVTECSTSTKTVSVEAQCTQYVSHDLSGLIFAASNFSSLLDSGLGEFQIVSLDNFFSELLQLPVEVYSGLVSLFNPSPFDILQILSAIDALVSGINNLITHYCTYFQALHLPAYATILLNVFVTSWVNMFIQWANKIVNTVISALASLAGCFDVTVIAASNLAIKEANAAIVILNDLMGNIVSVNPLSTIAMPTEGVASTVIYTTCTTKTI